MYPENEKEMGQKGAGVSQGSSPGSLLVGNCLLRTTLFLSLGRWGCDCAFVAASLADAVRCDCRLRCRRYNSSLPAVTATNVSFDWEKRHLPWFF